LSHGNQKTRNERFEDIEILRFVDLGYKVTMIRSDSDSIAVDHPGDIKVVERFLDERGME
jgi:3-deoxy-manno-octulosonate cytidylyltransferase (CMP-KDO synthetase)